MLSPDSGLMPLLRPNGKPLLSRVHRTSEPTGWSRPSKPFGNVPRHTNLLPTVSQGHGLRDSLTLESYTVYNTVYNTQPPYRATIRYYQRPKLYPVPGFIYIGAADIQCCISFAAAQPSSCTS